MPSLSCAEFAMCRVVPKSKFSYRNGPECYRNTILQEQTYILVDYLLVIPQSLSFKAVASSTAPYGI